jgi:hypothetical protein
MQARCRRSLIWAVPFLTVAFLGWAGARSASASELAAPEWMAQETAAPGMGTESVPPAMGTESAPPAMGSESPAMGSQPAGPSCTTNAQCHDTKMYCAKPNGQCKGKGECTAKPDICPDVVAPVCGCNGRTYNNECMAHRAGVNVRAEGRCKTKKSKKPAAAKTGT